MDSPVWSNDLLYVKELIIIMIVTVAMIGFCFYVSKRNDHKRTLRMTRAAAPQSADSKVQTVAARPEGEQPA